MARLPERNPGQPDGLPMESPPPTPEQIREAEQSEIGQFYRERGRRLQVIATTVTRSGQVLDWIDPGTQVRDGRLASPPPLPRAETRQENPDRPDHPVIVELDEQPEARGPAGTVPVPRPDVAKLGYGQSLQEFSSKASPLHSAAQRETSVKTLLTSKHFYANSVQFTPCYGGQGQINLWKPLVEWDDEFSLAQIAISDATQADPVTQTVEAGWQVYKSRYGDWHPHLFVFYTTNGYDSRGDFLGGYNQDYIGWVQVSWKYAPRMRLGPPYSTLGGSQYVIDIQYQLWMDNWWLRLNDEWVGYYPAYLFGSPGLFTRGSTISFYGEVLDRNHGVQDDRVTKTKMGSGQFPAAGFGQSAYMRNLVYQSAPSDAPAWTRYTGDVDSPNGSCYLIEGHFNNTDGWQSYCYWGGPGGNSSGCQPLEE